jgi:hypothetical protein
VLVVVRHPEHPWIVIAGLTIEACEVVAELFFGRVMLL